MFIFSVVLTPIVENLHRRSATPIRRAGQCAFLGSLTSTWQIFRDPKTRNFQGFRVEALGFRAGLTGNVTILFNMSSRGGVLLSSFVHSKSRTGTGTHWFSLVLGRMLVTPRVFPFKTPHDLLAHPKPNPHNLNPDHYTLKPNPYT